MCECSQLPKQPWCTLQLEPPSSCAIHMREQLAVALAPTSRTCWPAQYGYCMVLTLVAPFRHLAWEGSKDAIPVLTRSGILQPSLPNILL
jgi:hypothetical protein